AGILLLQIGSQVKVDSEVRVDCSVVAASGYAHSNGAAVARVVDGEVCVRATPSAGDRARRGWTIGRQGDRLLGARVALNRHWLRRQTQHLDRIIDKEIGCEVDYLHPQHRSSVTRVADALGGRSGCAVDLVALTQKIWAIVELYF